MAAAKKLRWNWCSHPLHFKQPAKTSRDTLLQKPTWFIQASNDEGKMGWGEVSIIEGLSVEKATEVEAALEKLVRNELDSLEHLPALRFALEMALSDLESPAFAQHFTSDFLHKEAGIPINGLVWIGEKDFMLKQIREKLAAGFDCIKLKVGGIYFEEELSLLRYIRKEHPQSEIELRLDANGAFTPTNALDKLRRLSDFDIHSIEQPVRQGQIEEMAKLCSSSPIPIALDEELIGITQPADQKELLEAICPPYIILKPSLLGGWEVCDRWIAIGKELNIDFWATSALESNLGLNAIAQWVATKNSSIWQGLGTGGLYHNNVDAPLEIEKGKLYYRQNVDWGMQKLDLLWQNS